MSLKKTIYELLFCCICSVYGCTEKTEDQPVYVYYLESNEHLGIEKGTKIFSLNYEIGTVSNVFIGKSSLVYQLSLLQENLFFYDTQWVLTEKGLELDNSKSILTAVSIGDTLVANATEKSIELPNFSLSEKTAVTQEDIDSLQLKIQNLSNLIDELNGTH